MTKYKTVCFEDPISGIIREGHWDGTKESLKESGFYIDGNYEGKPILKKSKPALDLDEFIQQASNTAPHRIPIY